MTDRDKLIRRFSDEVADAVHVHSPWPNEGKWTMDQELHLDLRVILGRLLDADRDERIVGLEILLSLSDKEAGSMEVGYLASLQERDQRIAALQHEVDSTRGLWCIDRDPMDVGIGWIRDHAHKLKARP